MASPTLVTHWNALTLEAIKATATPPPRAARALAMVHTAMYDAWTAYRPCELSTTTGSLLRRPLPEHDKNNRKKAYSYAAYRVLHSVFWCDLPAEKKDMFHDSFCELGYDPDDQSLDITKPQGIGNLSAKLIIEARAGDESNRHGTLATGKFADFTGYKSVNSLDEVKNKYRWQPLKSKNGGMQSFMLPHWGLVRPFALEYADQFRPKPPILETKEYDKQAKQVQQIAECLTEEQKIIAEYWADSAGSYTPPGHCCEIAHFISDRDNHDANKDICLYFALTNALFDASIAVWEAKRHFDYVRPITAIRTVFKGKDIKIWDDETIKGEDWQSYIPTPPFAEHVSGHSTFSAAAAAIFEAFTGSDKLDMSVKIPACSSLIQPNIPKKDLVLCWDTFKDAADEAGMSRRYGGLHFENGDIEGRRLGEKIGGCIWAKAQHYFNGGVVD
jgi:hypothetical protein